jgi:hypothetical protein
MIAMAGTTTADTGVNSRTPRRRAAKPDSPPLLPKNGSRGRQSALILALGRVQCRGTKSKFAPTHVGDYGAHKVDKVSGITPGKKTAGTRLSALHLLEMITGFGRWPTHYGSPNKNGPFLRCHRLNPIFAALLSAFVTLRRDKSEDFLKPGG